MFFVFWILSSLFLPLGISRTLEVKVSSSHFVQDELFLGYEGFSLNVFCFVLLWCERARNDKLCGLSVGFRKHTFSVKEKFEWTSARLTIRKSNVVYIAEDWEIDIQHPIYLEQKKTMLNGYESNV